MARGGAGVWSGSAIERPLLDKLGVKPAMKISLAGHDDPVFREALKERGADVSVQVRSHSDIIFMHASDARGLRRIAQLRSKIKPNGAIWVLRPKGGALRETDVIDAGLAAGMVDNKICSFSDELSAMRLVIRLRDRP